MTELYINLENIVEGLEKQPMGPAVLSVLRQRQVFPGEDVDRDGKLYEFTRGSDQEIWGVGRVGEHVIAALYVADSIGKALGLSSQARRNTNLAAFMHDSGKKTEQIWFGFLGETNPKSQGKRAKEKMRVLAAMTAMEEAENTLDVGLPAEVSRLMHANITRPDLKMSLQEQIVWFADAVLQGKRDGNTSHQHIVTVKERFDILDQNPASVEFSELFKEYYGGKTLFEVQRIVGGQVEKEFAGKMRMSVSEFYKWLGQRVTGSLKERNVPLLSSAKARGRR